MGSVEGSELALALVLALVLVSVMVKELVSGWTMERGMDSVMATAKEVE